VRKTCLTLFILLLLFSGQALARPLVMYSTIDPNGYAAPILIYSDEKINAYIPDDMINFNLFWSTYPQNGNFSFTVYIEPINEKLRQSMVTFVKERIANRTAETLGRPYPDLLQYIASDMYFDMENQQVTISREVFIDRDGHFIALRKGFKEVTPLAVDKHPLFYNIAVAASRVLENAKKNPKIADRLADMERQRLAEEKRQGSQRTTQSEATPPQTQRSIAVLPVNPPNAAISYQCFINAERFARDGDYSNAIHWYSEAIRNNPSLTDAYKARANMHFSHKQYNAAYEDYKKSSEMNQQAVFDYYLRAESYSQSKMKEEAQFFYKLFLDCLTDKQKEDTSITQKIDAAKNYLY
jgi:tetratricopeptide (TPR) repeat protein